MRGVVRRRIDIRSGPQVENYGVTQRQSSFLSTLCSLQNVAVLPKSRNWHASQVAALHLDSLRPCPRSFSNISQSTLGGTPSQVKDGKREAQSLTDELCNHNVHKLGSLTAQMWQQAIDLCRYWMNPDRLEEIDAPLALLERLLAEQEFLFQNGATIINSNNSSQALSETEKKKLQEVSKDLLTTDFLNGILRHWNVCWKKGVTKITPKTVFKELLENLAARSPSLIPDTKSYNLVLDGCTERYQKKNATELTNEIVTKMTNASRSSYFLNDENGVRSGNITPDTITYTILINIYGKVGNAQAAEDILNQMYDDYLAGRSIVQPNVRTFTSVISAWARSKATDAPEKAEAILELMYGLHETKAFKYVRPNLVTYNCLLDCWAKSGRKESGEQAEKLLRTMENMEGLLPDTISYNTVISAYLNGPKSVEGAEMILKRMIAAYIFNNNVKAQPVLGSFNLVLEAIQKESAKDEDAPLRAEHLLKHMIRLNIQPDLQSYNSVLGCWANSRHEKAGGRAEFILHEMRTAPEKAVKFPTKVVQPNALSYNNVITAYARSGNPQSAEMVFRAMCTEYRNGDNDVKPSLRTFNTVLYAWSHTATVTDAEKAKAILGLMHQLPELGVLGLKPDVVSYNNLLSCFSRIDSDDARAQAEQVLIEMENQAGQSKHETMKPDKYSYTCMMRALARAGEVEKTKALLDRMFELYKRGDKKLKPDIYAFNCVLQAISKNARGTHINAGKEAEALFKRILDLHANGILDDPPNKFSYDLRINCWGNSADARGPETAENILREMEDLSARGAIDCQPDAITWSSVINAHAKVGNHARAEEMLRQMFEKYAQGNQKMKPTLQTINTVLAALARSKESGSAQKAEMYLREMLAFQEASTLDLKPDIVTFSTVINCWANSGDPLASEQVKALFREVETLSRNDDRINLDAGFYRSVLRACSQTGDVSGAESLLREITSGFGDNSIKPDRYMYLALLQAYALSVNEDAADKAEALLREMDTLAISKNDPSLKPDALCYLAVLECWAKSAQTVRAVIRSEQLLLDMEQKARNGDQKMKPTPGTYSRVINTMARAGDMERVKKILRHMYTGEHEPMEAATASAY